jgi:hypothetical protein
MLPKRFIRQQQYFEGSRKRGLGLFPDYEQSVVADEDLACLCKQDHIVNPSTAGWFTNRKRTSSRLAANQSL